jgi:hypothetical protein
VATNLRRLSDEELDAEHLKRQAAVDEARKAAREVQHERDRRAGSVSSGAITVGAEGIESAEAVGKQS